MTGRRNGVDRGAIGAGVFFVLAGVLFLLDQLDVLTLRASYLWPALLIGLGVAVLAGAWTRRDGGGA